MNLTPTKRWINTPSACSRPVKPPLCTPLHPGCLFLVGCCVEQHRFSVVTFGRPKQCNGAPPHDPTRPHLLFNVPSIAAANSQLIVMSCLLTATTKGQDPPSSLFFDVAHVGTSNKGTDSGAAYPECARLVQAYRKRRHHDLVAPLTYPWR